VIINDESEGGLLEYMWEFGFTALPGTSDQPGPHEISYLLPGVKDVSLTVSNPQGTATTVTQIEVIDVPTGGWTFEELGGSEVQFMANFTNATSYRWDFGNGRTGSGQNPSHTYSSPGEYEVILRVGNMCGQKTLASVITVLTSETNELNQKLTASITPNPNQGAFRVNLEGQAGKDIQVNLFDINGRTIESRFVNLVGEKTSIEYSKDNLDPGIYYLEFRNELGNILLSNEIADAFSFVPTAQIA